MDPTLDDFFVNQEKLIALPEEDLDSYLARRANPNQSFVLLSQTCSRFQSYHSSRPFQLGNLPSMLSDNKPLGDPPGAPDPVDEPPRNPQVDFQGDTISRADAVDPVASPFPRTPVKGPAVDASDEPAPAAPRSLRDLSPRRVALTRSKRVAPALKIIQSSPIDTFSPVASSTPARPPASKVLDDSPLLGKRRHKEANANPTKPKSKGKGKAVHPVPEQTSPIESPRFDTSALGRTSKRPREDAGSPSPPPKRKTLRAGVLPTSPINSAVFPPNTELPPIPILSRQGSVTVSSGQLHKRKPRDDRVIKIKPRLPPPAEAPVADTSVIESFDTPPHRPPTTTKQASSVDNKEKPQEPVTTAAVETSFLTSPGSSPEKQPTSLPPLPPPPSKPSQRAQVKTTAVGSASPENSQEGPVSNSKSVAISNPPLPGKAVKNVGVTKLKPVATMIPASEAGPSKTSTTMPLRSRSSVGQAQTKKNPIIPTKKGKNKPARMTPVEYSEMLIEKHANPDRIIPNVSQHLRGRKILYVGVDMKYAGDATKKKMEYVRTRDSTDIWL